MSWSHNKSFASASHLVWKIWPLGALHCDCKVWGGNQFILFWLSFRRKLDSLVAYLGLNTVLKQLSQTPWVLEYSFHSNNDILSLRWHSYKCSSHDLFGLLSKPLLFRLHAIFQRMKDGKLLYIPTVIKRYSFEWQVWLHQLQTFGAFQLQSLDIKFNNISDYSMTVVSCAEWLHLIRSFCCYSRGRLLPDRVSRCDQLQ